MVLGFRIILGFRITGLSFRITARPFATEQSASPLSLNGVRRCVPVALQPFTQGAGVFTVDLGGRASVCFRWFLLDVRHT